MANFDTTAAAGALKELYDDQVVAQLVYKDQPLLAMIPKKTNFIGKNYPQPIVTASSQSGSRTFAYASTAGYLSPPEIDQFVVTRAKDYATARIETELLLAAKEDKGAFLEGAKLNMDSAIQQVRRSMGWGVYQDKNGVMGQATGTLSTGVITLANSDDVVKFERNMVLQASTAEDSGGPAALGYVVKRDSAAGTVTVSDTRGGSAATPSGWTGSGYYFHRYGDRGVALFGLRGWLPDSAPSAGESFFGVDRSVDPTRLAGIRKDYSSLSVDEALIKFSLLMAREEAAPTHAFMNFTSYAALELSLGTKVQYVDVTGPVDLRFRGIKLTGARGVMQIFPDAACRPLRCYCLTLADWKLRSLGPAPQILSQDGLTLIPVAGDDAYEVRIGMYGNVMCQAPGRSGVLTLGA